MEATFCFVGGEFSLEGCGPLWRLNNIKPPGLFFCNMIVFMIPCEAAVYLYNKPVNCGLRPELLKAAHASMHSCGNRADKCPHCAQSSPLELELLG